MPTTIDPYSLATVPITQLANGKTMNTATGFVWRHGQQHYLVTNWHVITGRNARTRELETPVRPEALRVLFNVRVGSFGKQQWDINIRDDEIRPLWLVYPGQGRAIDLVVLPIPLTGSDPACEMYPINTLPKSNLAVRVGMDVFVLGYPFGVEPPGFPIWKRGSIASEPDIVQMTTNYLLVDTASRPGMSGAPVIRRSWCVHLRDDGGLGMDGSAETRLIGIYSGRRYTKNGDDAQLGIVWPIHLIESIVAGNHRDDDFADR